MVIPEEVVAERNMRGLLGAEHVPSKDLAVYKAMICVFLCMYVTLK